MPWPAIELHAYEQCSQMVLDQLAAAGAGDTAHAGASLLVHLRNTQKILERWQCPPGLCLAGLCHSVYGAVFPLRQAARRRVADWIGAEAERVVWFIATVHADEVARRLLVVPTGDANMILARAALVLVASDFEQLGRVLLSPRQIEQQRHLAIQCLHWLPEDARADLVRLYAVSPDSTDTDWSRSTAEVYDAEARRYNALRELTSDDVQLLQLVEKLLPPGRGCSIWVAAAASRSCAA